MSNHSELRDMRSEGINFKSKYKFMILKNYLDVTNNGSICLIQRKNKIHITISIRFLF